MNSLMELRPDSSYGAISSFIGVVRPHGHSEAMENHGLRFLLILSIITAPLAAGAFVFSFDSSRHFSNHGPAGDDYVPPRDIGAIVDKTQASTVIVKCDVPGEKGKGAYGSGWSIDLPADKDQLRSGFSSLIVTNHHVIEDCLTYKKSKVEIAKFEGKWSQAYIVRFDEENDLALLRTKAKIPTLALSEWAPFPGYWTMAVGTADGYEGSVAIGTALNLLDTEILITNNISSGNSGGPLIDNEGNVVGVVTWSSTREQYNGAKSLDAMCAVIIPCEGKTFWKWE
jgi:S1-C subfamily serine protease